MFPPPHSYAAGIVGQAMHLLVHSAGSLIDRLSRAFGVLHPVVALAPDASWGVEHQRMVEFYVLFLERGDGVMKVGIALSHSSKRRAGAKAVMELQAALCRDAT